MTLLTFQYYVVFDYCVKKHVVSICDDEKNVLCTGVQSVKALGAGVCGNLDIHSVEH